MVIYYNTVMYYKNDLILWWNEKTVLARYFEQMTYEPQNLPYEYIKCSLKLKFKIKLIIVSIKRFILYSKNINTFVRLLL